MEQLAERPVDGSVDVPVAEIIRPFVQYWWVILAGALVAVFALLGIASSRPMVYSSHSLIMVDSTYADPNIVADLMKE